MLRTIYCLFVILLLSACISEPLDPSFMGAREIDTDEAAKTRVSLGLTYLKNGNFTQAKFNLDKALEFAPRDGEAHFAMAFYYQTVGEAKLAEESYKNALSYSKNDPDVVNSYGAFLCQEGRYKEAKSYFLKAVNDRNYASTAQTYENLAICSQSQGVNAEAIEYFTSALNHQPTRLQSLYLLTNVYIDEKQWENAKRTLFKYERVAPVSAESLYMQFQIAQGLNDTETAVGYGEILKSMYPEHPNTQKYLAEMGKFKPAATITRKTTVTAPIQTPVLTSSTDIAPEAVPAQTPLETEDVGESVGEGISEQSNELVNEVEGLAAAVNDEPELPEVIIESVPPELVVSKSALAELASDEREVQNTVDADEAGSAIEAAEQFNQLDTESQLQALLDSGAVESPVVASSTETNNIELVKDEIPEEALHVVQKQENLYRISIKYNVKMRFLIEWNDLEDESIEAGMKLWVRNPSRYE